MERGRAKNHKHFGLDSGIEDDDDPREICSGITRLYCMRGNGRKLECVIESFKLTNRNNALCNFGRETWVNVFSPQLYIILKRAYGNRNFSEFQKKNLYLTFVL